MINISLNMSLLPLLIKCVLYFVLIYTIFFLYKYCKFAYKISKINGPKRHPLFGNIPDLICESDVLFKKLRLWAKTFYPVYTFILVPFMAVSLFAPEDIELLLSSTKHSTKSPGYHLMHNWLKQGLLTSSGAKWQERRKLLTPTFHFSILEQFISVFHKETKRLVDNLKEACNKPYVDVVPIIAQFALYTINETSMGTKLDLTKKEDMKYHNAIIDIGQVFYSRVIKPWKSVPFIYKFIFPKEQSIETALTKTLHNYTNNIILKKIKSTGPLNPPKKRLAMLDLLINMNNEGTIDIDGIREEVDTFMFEGHDTISMGLSFMLMLLAGDRKVQDLIVEEINDVIGDTNVEPTFQKLNNLKYMEQCIRESLRLYPSVPLISRTADEDITISSGDVVPKGTIVNVYIYDIHRIPSIYPDPEKFDPERFSPENSLNRHPFAYIPFSAGPRNCIGQKFASFELKTVLIGILTNFVLDPVDTQETVVILIDMVLRPKNGIKIKFTKRV